MPFWSSSRKSTDDTASETASMNQNDVEASASAAAGTEWLSGHLHHLSSEQEGKLDEFKKLCADKGYYKADVGDGSGRPSHGDETVLRFLRARKFDITAAWTQFQETEDWRRDNALDKVYENIDVDSYEAARRMYPQWTGRRDLRGIPVYVFEIKHLNTKNMAAYNETLSKSNLPDEAKTSAEPERLLRLFALYEHLLRFVMPVCSALRRPNPETPIVASNNIVDVSGVGLKQFWNLKGHMQDASVLATAHYPETLDRIFLIGAPSFFPTVWSWIKRWFDPGTTSKIFILSANEVFPTLSSFMAPSSIPKAYGGELDWSWGDMPCLDDDARAVISGVAAPAAESTDKQREGRTESGYLKGPMLFNEEKGRTEVLGRVNGESRRFDIPVTGEPKKLESSDGSSFTTPAVTPAATPADEKAVEVGAGAGAGDAPAQEQTA